MLSKMSVELPGPGDYNADKSIYFLKDRKINNNSMPFASKIDRFPDPDPIAPGPKYAVPGAF